MIRMAIKRKNRHHWKLWGNDSNDSNIKANMPICNRDYRAELRGEGSDVNREVVRTAWKLIPQKWMMQNGV